MDEYLRGIIQIPIERKYLENARVWARVVSQRYNADVQIDDAASYIIIRPRAGVSVDEILRLQDMARALSFGFSPEDVMRLEGEDYRLDYVDVKEHVGRQHLHRVLARVIGEGGRAKSTIEALTGTKIAVTDRYVAILGPLNAVSVAKEAIMMLIEGKKHGTVYRYIQRSIRSY
ncbi:KH domain-containing protein [Thermoproteus tenax]|uniref:Predicted RNA-binding protein, KH domain n=1 Tax=Thermoproteus tenax (strain ATCC 35583 / DSM 2078 / JCM 9277 / NBRC 100435 / Kra 1) TaxID=768679 RepID=G4RP77_THETK|nr:KH domain-containing protein [Thermoproteus tenax]CCC81372.1 predicted RNA-binding protein, KH domain [Thermoproteus tenax Kra 1]